jgi:transposase
MIFLFILYDIKSEWELMISLPLRLDWLWFLGPYINEVIPGFGILSKERKSLGDEAFKRLFKGSLIQATKLYKKKLFCELPFLSTNSRKRSIKYLNEEELESIYNEFISRLKTRKVTKFQFSILPKTSNIEHRISSDHPLRGLKEKLNFYSIGEQFLEKYGKNDCLSVSITVLIKTMILILLYNVRSENEFEAKLPLQLDWLWFLGLELDDKITHKNILINAYKSLGEEAFEELFKNVVNHVIDTHIVDDKRLLSRVCSIEEQLNDSDVKFVYLDLDTKYADFLEKFKDKEKNIKSLFGRISYNIFDFAV